MRACTLLLIGLAGCAGTPEDSGPPPIEARSLLGADLPRLELRGERREHYEAELRAARERWAEKGREDDAIWVGRHLGYLGRYQEAIDWYTARLRQFPRSARLRRHRGHRFLSVRRPDRAESDLVSAWILLEGTKDVVEPDGAPNRYGIPRSTTQTNVLYHLGLAYYLQQDWEAAAEAFDMCRERCPNDDMLVAALNWQVHSLRRTGLHYEARELLVDVHERMEVLENEAYLQLLLLQMGQRIPDEIVGRGGDGVQDATSLYGIATWSYCNGNEERARTLWRAIVDRTPWNSFGHICAEAELAR